MDWAYRYGKNSGEASEWYPDMKETTGVDLIHGSFQDFQRLFKCKGLTPADCNGLTHPKQCSVPPCNTCSATKSEKIARFYGDSEGRCKTIYLI